MTSRQNGKLRNKNSKFLYFIFKRIKEWNLITRRKHKQMSTTTEDSEFGQLQTDLYELKVKPKSPLISPLFYLGTS